MNLNIKYIIFIIAFFLLLGNVSASSLITPKITGFSTIEDESNALKLSFNSNGNTGTNFSYEIINATLGKTNNLAGSAKYYVYQNLPGNREYKVIIRVCSNSGYVCSNWTSPVKATLGNTVNIKTPVITKITSTISTVTLYYNVNSKAEGVEIYCLNNKKSYRTTNLNRYTITNFRFNNNYKFKIRSYTYKKNNNLSYSNYSAVKSLCSGSSKVSSSLKVPTLKKITSINNKSVKLTYKTKGKFTGVEIYNITTGKKVHTKNKKTYTDKKVSSNKKYKYKIRTYLKKNNEVVYSSYSKTKSVSTKLSGSEMIARSAEELAWPLGTSRSVWHHNYSKHKKFTSWSQLGKARPTNNFKNAYDKVRKNHWSIGSGKWGYWTRIGASCDVFVGTSVRYSGYDKKFPFSLGSSKSQQLGHMNSSSKWKRVSKAKRGDVCYRSGHIKIYLGNGRVAEAGYLSKRFGAIHKDGCSSRYKIFRATK